MKMTRFAFAAAWIAAALAIVRIGHAGPFPDRPIRLVTAFNGGISDIVAHGISARLGQELRQPVVVNAQPGAGGNIGVKAVAQAAPDGYTLLLGGGWLYTNALLQPTEFNDPDTRLTGIAPIVSVPFVWVASPQCGCRTLADLGARALIAPLGLSYGSPGIGTPPHLLAEQFARASGLELLHVPYKGGGALTTASLSGEVDFSIVSLTTALPHIKQGRLVALAVTSAQRAPQLPEVATVREQGHPAQEVSTWFGLFGPASLDHDAAQRLRQAAEASLQDPSLQNRFAEAAARTYTPREIGAFGEQLANERKLWAEAAKGVKP